MDQRFRQGSPGASHASLSLAHDFRNLLQLATSGVQLARRELVLKCEIQLASILHDAIQALERANILARRLSGPARSECDEEDVLLQEVVPELRSLLSQALGGRIEFESLVASNLPPIRCDRLQLENVLLNLAVNSRHAMPQGGRLVIEAVPCACQDHRHCIALSVTDSGHGMSEDVAAQAFEPFFSTRLLEGGTGLGLFNARAFAEVLGGTAQLSSNEGSGTRVTLHLPGQQPVGFR
jgi:signal transduction histidine kinase